MIGLRTGIRPWLLSAATLAVGGFIRFWRLKGMGLFSIDAAIYVTWTQHWWVKGVGDWLNGWGKPGYHFLCWLMARVVGIHDYTVLYVSAACDCVNILLILLVGRLLGFRWYALWLSAAVYALLPFALRMSSSGLPHTASLMFMLLSFGCLVAARRHRVLGWFLTAGSGAFLFAAGAVHPTLLVLLPIFAVLAMIEVETSGTAGQRMLRRLMRGGMLAVSWVLAMLAFARFVSWAFADVDNYNFLSQMLGKWFAHGNAARQGVGGSLPEKLAVAVASFWRLLSPLGAVAVACFAGYAASVRVRARRDRGSDGGEALSADESGRCRTLGIVVGGFIAIGSAVFHGWSPRCLFPLVPFVLWFVLAGMAPVMETRRSARAAVISTLLVVCLLGLATGLEVITKPPTLYKQVHTRLRGKVDSRNRLLIGPSNLVDYHMESLYLDGQHIYKLTGNGRVNRSMLDEHRIRYVEVARKWTRIRGIVWPVEEGTADEYRAIEGDLAAAGAVKFYESRDVALYEIPTEGNTVALSDKLKTPEGFPFYHVGNIGWREPFPNR